MPNTHARNFLVRLPISIKEEASRLASQEGVSLNHFISLALAEKLARMGAPRFKTDEPPGMDRHHGLKDATHADEPKAANRYTGPSS